MPKEQEAGRANKTASVTLPPMRGHGISYEQRGRDEIPMLLTPGFDGGFNLRFRPEHTDEVKTLLDEQGLEHSTAAEFSEGPALAIEAVHFLAAAGGLGALTAFYKAFIRRHDGKRVVITEDGIDAAGLSPKQLREVIEKQEALRQKRDAEPRRAMDLPEDLEG